jgi:hypothetical protein
MSRSTFFFSVEIFKIETFQSRLWRVKIFVEIARPVQIVEICQDASRLSRFVETQSRFVEKSWHCRGLLSLKMMKSLDGLRNLDEKIQKSTHFSIEIETNCREMPKFSDLDEILNLDRDFLVWTLLSRQNRDISIVETNFLTLSRFSQLSRLTLWQRRDRESRSRPRWDKSRPPCLRKTQFYLSEISNLNLK